MISINDPFTTFPYFSLLRFFFSCFVFDSTVLDVAVINLFTEYFNTNYSSISALI